MPHNFKAPLMLEKSAWCCNSFNQSFLAWLTFKFLSTEI
uniref:Uncharacterized protein n=1 Tax=Rhizophora mucronata TaxID=61149 RepID=A0A2P2PF39_RHIMU